MSHFTLSTFIPERFPGLKVLYIANDAPSSVNNGSLPEYYNTGYHNEIYQLLVNMGVNVWSTRDIQELIDKGGKYDYIFTLINRMEFDNSEIFVSAWCEMKGLKYLGAKPNIRALAEDKHLTKILCKYLNIPTADWVTYRSGAEIDNEPAFDGPYFVKWRYGASSRFITEDNCVFSWEDAKNQIKQFHSQGKDVIVEKLLLGSVITVPVLSAINPIVLPPVVSISSKPFGLITFEQARKLEGGLQRAILRDDAVIKKVKEYGLALFNSIKPTDYIRADFRIDRDTGEPNLLEINICCNLSSTSAISMAGTEVNLSQKQIVSHILYESLVRQGC